MRSFKASFQGLKSRNDIAIWLLLHRIRSKYIADLFHRRKIHLRCLRGSNKIRTAWTNASTLFRVRLRNVLSDPVVRSSFSGPFVNHVEDSFVAGMPSGFTRVALWVSEGLEFHSANASAPPTPTPLLTISQPFPSRQARLKRRKTRIKA